jgi:hypothetical protein
MAVGRRLWLRMCPTAYAAIFDIELSGSAVRVNFGCYEWNLLKLHGLIMYLVIGDIVTYEEGFFPRTQNATSYRGIRVPFTMTSLFFFFFHSLRNRSTWSTEAPPDLAIGEYCQVEISGNNVYIVGEIRNASGRTGEPCTRARARAHTHTHTHMRTRFFWKTVRSLRKWQNNFLQFILL